jgi:surfeit locus 1 family protein
LKRFSLKFILGTFISLIMIITLLLLGMWQLQRLEWKEHHTKQLLNMDPKSFMPIEETILSLKGKTDVTFRKVRVKGFFYHNLSIELIPRTWHGKSGAHVYTPMVVQPSGHLLMVNRGWVPDEKKDLKYDNPVGEVDLMGYLQQPMVPGWMTPDNVVHQKAWYYMDLDAMEDEVAKEKPEVADKMLPFYMISIETRTGDEYPKPIDVMAMVKNNHFGYALTWFFLAIALAVMYIFFIRRNHII